MPRLGLIPVLVLGPLAACAAEVQGPAGGGGGGKADEFGPPVIELREDFSILQSGPVVAGEEVVIRYDLDRMSDCRAEQGGQAAWMVTGFAMVDDSAPQSFSVARLADGAVLPVDATLSVPARGQTLAFFFQVSNTFGCRAWDSNFGANYVFPISPGTERPVSAVLVFQPDGSVSQDGAVEARTRVLVQYDPARLAECAESQDGFARWTVTGHFMVDGLRHTSFGAADSLGGELVPTDRLIDVGDGDLLELWFEASSATGCHQFDSNFGQNHRFPIE